MYDHFVMECYINFRHSVQAWMGKQSAKRICRRRTDTENHIAQLLVGIGKPDSHESDSSVSG